MFVDPYGLCREVGPNLYKVIDCGEIDCKMSNNYIEGDFSAELAVLRGETDTYKGVKIVVKIGFLSCMTQQLGEILISQSVKA